MDLVNIAIMAPSVAIYLKMCAEVRAERRADVAALREAEAELAATGRISRCPGCGALFPWCSCGVAS